MDKFSLKSKAQDIRIEISENIKDQNSISLFIAFLRQQEIHPFIDSTSRFKISFSLKRDIIRVSLAEPVCRVLPEHRQPGPLVAGDHRAVHQQEALRGDGQRVHRDGREARRAEPEEQ